MFFNKYTQVECVHEEDYNETQFFFELSKGLHPLKVIECR